MLRVGLDLQILERPCPTGVERAWRCLVLALLERPDAGRLVLYSREPVDLGVPLPPHAQPVPLGGPDRASLWRETRLGPALKQDGVALLHSPVAAIPLRSAVPRIATVHEIPWIRNPGVEGRLREVAHRLRVRAAAAFAAAIVVPSESTARDLASLHPAAAPRIRVVPHGVDPFFLAPRAPAAEEARVLARVGLEGTRFLLAVGACRPRKGLATLLAAFDAYRRAGGDRVLALAGPGHPPPGPPAGVRVLGWLEDADLRVAYRHADALVYHSLNEGFGLPPLEAMALGTPVVAAAAGAVPEVTGDAALLVPPGDAGALAEALGRACGDEALRARLREAGAARARAFSFAVAAERTVALWREVASGALPGAPEAGRAEAAPASNAP